MQRSQEGLLQLLLYEIFRHELPLIRALCSQTWQRAGVESGSEAWTLHELYDILLHFETSGSLGVQFCFFIDGLDEYGASYMTADVKSIMLCALVPFQSNGVVAHCAQCAQFEYTFRRSFKQGQVKEVIYIILKGVLRH